MTNANDHKTPFYHDKQRALQAVLGRYPSSDSGAWLVV